MVWKHATTHLKSRGNIFNNATGTSVSNGCNILKSSNTTPFQNHTFKTKASLSVVRATMGSDLQSLRMSQISRSALAVGSMNVLSSVCGLNAERNIPRGWDEGIMDDDDDGG